MFRYWCAVLTLTFAAVAQAQTPAAKPQALPAPMIQPRVDVKTTLGTIVVELDRERAPVTVENFLKYMESGHYDGTLFHRVINGFMIQGGGMDRAMQEKPTRAPIKLESQNGLKNAAGTIAMARTRVPDSATSQFFINVVDNPRLDFPNPDGHGYAVFGKVVEGMEIVDKIKAVATTNRAGHANVPVEPIVIESVKLHR